MDLFDQLPIDVSHKILLSSLNTSEQSLPTLRSTSLSRRFSDSKQVLKTCILSKSFLQASSTLPVLNFSCKPINNIPRFAKYLEHTLTRYQQHNISLQTLRFTVDVNDVSFANFLYQLIRKSDNEYGVIKEIYLTFSSIPYSNLLLSIFSFKKLVSLTLAGCDILYNDFDFLVNCSYLRTLELYDLPLNQSLLDKLFHSCPLIEVLLLIYCKTPVIKVANLPNLKRLEVVTADNQTVDINAPSLELMMYKERHRCYPYLPSIESTQNLKSLSLQSSTLTDGQFHNFIAKCPVLEELILDHCFDLKNLKLSSDSLTFLRFNACLELTEVKIDAPVLTEIEFGGDNVPRSLAFTSRYSGEKKSDTSVTLGYPKREQEFLKLSEYLKICKSSDNILLLSFGKD